MHLADKFPAVRLCLLACLWGLGGIAQAQQPPQPRIVISGDSAPELHANILSHLRIGQEPCDAGIGRLQRLLPQIRRNVTAAANALGYYQTESTATFSEAEGCWQLDLQVVPGSRVTLDTVNIQVQGEPEVVAQFQDILDRGVLRSGSPLHHGEYEVLKNAFSSRAADRGFFGARFEQAEIALDLENNRAGITLIFAPGEQFRFGEIVVNTDGNLSDELIDGLLPIEEGDLYSSEELVELRERLDASQYFRQIRVSPQIGLASGDTVPVEVELGMRPRHAWTTGLGFSTDTGPRARLSYENRYVNSRGHKLLADSEVSQVRSQVNANYSIPLWDPARQSLNIGSGFSFDNNDSFESKRWKTTVGVRNETVSGWLQNVFVDWQRDDYVVADEEDTSVLFMPGASLGRTSADNLIHPTSGWKLFTQLRGASNSLLSDTTFVQLYGSAKHVMSFGTSRLLSRIELGATWIDEAEELPASLRYFAGGDQSVRGYEFRSLGPLDENGEVVGGKQLVVGSLEYDFAVRNNWRVAVFVDSGNSFNTADDIDFQHSAGLGVRWLSPIGPVRVDLAHPINGEESFRFHITMGPDL